MDQVKEKQTATRQTFTASKTIAYFSTLLMFMLVIVTPGSLIREHIFVYYAAFITLATAGLSAFIYMAINGVLDRGRSQNEMD